MCPFLSISWPGKRLRDECLSVLQNYVKCDEELRTRRSASPDTPDSLNLIVREQLKDAEFLVALLNPLLEKMLGRFVELFQEREEMIGMILTEFYDALVPLVTVSARSVRVAVQRLFSTPAIKARMIE